MFRLAESINLDSDDVNFKEQKPELVYLLIQSK